MKIIELPKSTYYFEINKTNKVANKNEKLSREIKTIFTYHKGRYGVRRIHKELQNKGIKVNHKRVQRLMHEMCLFGKTPKEKYHSYQGNIGKIADNIINRDFSADKPLKKWTTDVSQFNFSWGEMLYISYFRYVHKRNNFI